MKEARARLKNEFVIRTRTNPRYSLRAFARDLDVSPSLLCEVLNGKRNFSASKVLNIGKKLNWGTSANVERRPSDAIKSLGWLHLTILELAEFAPIARDNKNIARILGVPEKAVDFAIETLLTQNLLEVTKNILKPIPDRLFFGTETPSAEIRRFHKEFLDLAKSKIDTTNFDERELSSSLLSLSKDQVQELRSRIRVVVEDFSKYSRQSDEVQDIYGFSIQLFKVSPTL